MIELTDNLLSGTLCNNTLPINLPSKNTVFNGLNVKNHLDLNFTFFFYNSDSKCKLNSVVLSFKPLDDRIVTTFYYKKGEKHFSLIKANPEGSFRVTDCSAMKIGQRP